MTFVDEPAAPDTVVLSLPPRWVEVPLTSDGLQDRVRSSVESLDPALADTIEFRRLLVLLGRTVDAIDKVGATMLVAYVDDAANGAEESGAAEEVEDPYLVSALGWLVTRTAADLRTTAVRLADLTAAAEASPERPDRRPLEPPRLVDMTRGQAVREAWLQRVDGVGLDRPAEVLQCRYTMVIGDGVGMAALGFSTPNVELADEMVALFGAIAATLDFVTA